jgi:hypothetical protein
MREGYSHLYISWLSDGSLVVHGKQIVHQFLTEKFSHNVNCESMVADLKVWLLSPHRESMSKVVEARTQCYRSQQQFHLSLIQLHGKGRGQLQV